MVAIRIRPVRSGDWSQFEKLVAGICAFHGDSHQLTRLQFDELAARENAPVTVLVAETEDGDLAGFAAGFAIYNFHDGQTLFEIQNLFVAEHYRRQRIGESLMVALMQFARHHHRAAGFKIGALKWNDAAIAFYRQMGFGVNPRAHETTRLFKKTA
ncbi:MAG: N-acetyltransferase [Pseudobdellovibrionaceae bacterium]